MDAFTVKEEMDSEENIRIWNRRTGGSGTFA
jgi:hypothetical protein